MASPRISVRRSNRARTRGGDGRISAATPAWAQDGLFDRIFGGSERLGGGERGAPSPGPQRTERFNRPVPT